MKNLTRNTRVFTWENELRYLDGCPFPDGTKYRIRSPLHWNIWYGHFPVDRNFFFQFQRKTKKKKKHEPLKFNGYSLVAKNTLHVRARPNHLSVCNVQKSVSRLMGISHIVLTTRFFFPGRLLWTFREMLVF